MVNRRGLRALALAATLFSTFPVMAGAAETRAKSTVSTIHIDNFGQVNANYYRGAQPEARDFADLARFGIKTVIDFTEDGNMAEPSLVKNLGMNFYRIPMTTRQVPTAEQLAQFLKIVNDPANRPVYVHCQGGRHRTGVMTAVYRMTNDGWTGDRAFGEMKQYKFGSDFLHPEFKQFVHEFKPTPKETLPSVVALTAPQ